MNILILEDEPIIVEDLISQLKQIGFSESSFANSVRDAKKLVEKLKFDLVIVDIDLGEKENGLDFSNWLDVRSIPYIFLSGKQDPVTFHRTMQTKALANIEKPVTLNTLRNTIFSALNHKSEPKETSHKIIVPVGEGELLVRVEEILFIKASRSYCELQLRGEEKPRVISVPMVKMIERINSPFIVRIHRSHAVNIHHVSFRKGNLLTTSPDFPPLEIGRNYRDIVNKILNDH